MRLLTTGFETFGGFSENPTELLMLEIQKGKIPLPTQLEVRAVVLPVTFRQAYQELEKNIQEFRPELVLAFGLAVGRSSIDLERVAINCINAEIADNEGYRPVERKINPQGPDAYFSTLPITQLAQALNENGFRSSVSNTAGTYVCNYLFYRLMETAKLSDIRGGFIHVPGRDSLAPEELLQAWSVMVRNL
ncbi:MAG TPA: hypothetical protein VNJ01_11175 [Bacteriovoracaceae bacterium]|nr:hypothetical protein [Bacteriovoracaceae bacterium]